MFDKLKQLAQLREMEGKMKEERATIEKNGTKVTVNGKFEVEEIILNPTFSVEDQQRILKDCINEANKKVQFSLAQKMMGMMQ